MLSTAYSMILRRIRRRPFRYLLGPMPSRAAVWPNERGRYGYYIWEDGPRHNTSALGRNHGLYLQDTWRVTPRLTINAGVRLEREFMPPYQRVVNGREVANPD